MAKSRSSEQRSRRSQLSANRAYCSWVWGSTCWSPQRQVVIRGAGRLTAAEVGRTSVTAELRAGSADASTILANRRSSADLGASVFAGFASVGAAMASAPAAIIRVCRIIRESSETSFQCTFAKWLKALQDSVHGLVLLIKKLRIFNDITAPTWIVWGATFIDLSLTKCHIVRLDSVKGAINGNEHFHDQ